MKTKGEAFAGLSVALVTPFAGGKIDYDIFRDQIEFQIAAGTDCLCPVGTTGECPTLSHEEHERIIGFRGRHRRGPDQGHARHRLEQHGRGPPADEVRRKGRRRRGPAGRPVLQQADADRLLRALSSAWPSRPACRSASTTSRAERARTSSPKRSSGWPSSKTSRIVKEATGSLDQASQIISATDLTVLSGDDSLTLPLMSVGARGVISVVGNIVPKDMLALIAAVDAGNLAEAQRWHHKLFPLCRDMLGLSTNPIPIKAAMKILGRDPGELRPADDAAGARRRNEAAQDALDLRRAGDKDAGPEVAVAVAR